MRCCESLALRQLNLHPHHHRPPVSIPHALTLLFPPSSVSRLFCGLHPQRSRASCANEAWLAPLPPHAAAASPPLAGASGGSGGGGTYNTNIIGIGCILLPRFRRSTGGDCCGNLRRRRALAATSATPQHTENKAYCALPDVYRRPSSASLSSCAEYARRLFRIEFVVRELQLCEV
jgi:hypothetical protein